LRPAKGKIFGEKFFTKNGHAAQFGSEEKRKSGDNGARAVT